MHEGVTYNEYNPLEYLFEIRGNFEMFQDDIVLATYPRTSNISACIGL